MISRRFLKIFRFLKINSKFGKFRILNRRRVAAAAVSGWFN